MFFKNIFVFLFAYFQILNVTSLIRIPLKGISGDICRQLNGKKLFIDKGTDTHIVARNVSLTLGSAGFDKRPTVLRSYARPRREAAQFLQALRVSHPSGLLKKIIESGKRMQEIGALVQRMRDLDEFLIFKLKKKFAKNQKDLDSGFFPSDSLNVDLENQDSVENSIMPSPRISVPNDDLSGFISIRHNNKLTDTKISSKTTTSASIILSEEAKNTNSKALVLEDFKLDHLVNDTTSFPEDFSSFINENASSNLASNRPPPSRCLLELLTCQECHLELKLVKINLAPCPHDHSCQCDYVSMGEPPYQSDGGLNVCNTDEGTTYISQTRHVTIDFLYRTSYHFAFDISVTAKKNVYHVENTNDMISGTIGTPFFPEAYPSDLWMEYVFLSKNQRHRIKVSFADFLISPWSVVEIEDTNKTRMAKFTGEIFRPPVLVSSGSTLIFRFKANGKTERGFKMEYDFVNAGSVESLPPVADCGGQVTNVGGVITMINMTSSANITVLFDCIWIFKASQDLAFRTHLSLKVFQFLSLEPSSELEIRQGLTSENLLLAKINGNNWISNKDKEYVVAVDAGFYIRLRASFKSGSKLVIIYSSFSYFSGCHSMSDFLCLNNRCIPKILHCDGYDHCGDNSDEPRSCYHGRIGGGDATSWYRNPPNYYFPPKTSLFEPSQAFGVLLLLAIFILMLIIVGLLVYLFRPTGRNPSRRTPSTRVLAAFNDDVEIFDASDDDPPVYESPPDYDDVVKLILSGNNLKLVRRPGGIITWASDFPAVGILPEPCDDNPIMLTHSTNEIVGGPQPDKLVQRTRHASYDAEDRQGVVVWSSDSSNELSNLINKRMEQFRGSRKTSLPSPPCLPKHLHISPLASTTFLSPSSGSTTSRETVPNISGESYDYEDQSRSNYGLDSHISSCDSSGATPGTSSEGKIWKKHTVPPSETNSDIGSDPPSYEIVIQQMIDSSDPALRELLKSNNRRGVKSSSIIRRSRKRRSTLLRVRAAREIFQKLARGEDVTTVNNTSILDVKEGTVLYQEDTSFPEKVIAKGTVMNRKKMLFKQKDFLCDCEAACTCSALTKPYVSDYTDTDFVNPGYVKSTVQHYLSGKGDYLGNNNQKNLHTAFHRNGKNLSGGNNVFNDTPETTETPCIYIERFGNFDCLIDESRLTLSMDNSPSETFAYRALQKPQKIQRSSSYP